MEKYLAAVLLTIGFSVNAKTITGTMPVVCADAQGFTDAITEFDELPTLTALSNRDMGEGLLVPVSLVVFLNPKTGTYTIAEKVEDMYCVIAMGENMTPYIDNEPQVPRKGT
jgi:hypothetical protein